MKSEDLSVEDVNDTFRRDVGGTGERVDLLGVMTSASKSYLVTQSRPSSRVQESTSIEETESTTSSGFRDYYVYLDV